MLATWHLCSCTPRSDVLHAFFVCFVCRWQRRGLERPAGAVRKSNGQELCFNKPGLRSHLCAQPSTWRDLLVYASKVSMFSHRTPQVQLMVHVLCWRSTVLSTAVVHEQHLQWARQEQIMGKMTATEICENIQYPMHVPNLQFMMWHGDSSIRSSRNLMTTGSRGLRCLYLLNIVLPLRPSCWSLQWWMYSFIYTGYSKPLPLQKTSIMWRISLPTLLIS